MIGRGGIGRRFSRKGDDAVGIVFRRIRLVQNDRTSKALLNVTFRSAGFTSRSHVTVLILFFFFCLFLEEEQMEESRLSKSGSSNLITPAS